MQRSADMIGACERMKLAAANRETDDEHLPQQEPHEARLRNNQVACVSESAPGPAWELADATILDGLTQLWIQAGVRYYGYL